MTWSSDQEDRRSSGETVSWKSYVDAIFDEHRVQVETALASHDTRVASNKESVTERLEALHESMTRLMEAGDEALQHHVDAQKTQISSEFGSVDKRLTAQHAEMVLRDEAIRDLLSSETRAYDTRVREAFAASEKAIEKAETSTEKRFDSGNAYRKQLSEQATQFLPREVADAQFAELRKLIQRNTERLDLDQGNNQAIIRTENRTQPWQLWTAGALLSVLIVIINVIVGIIVVI